MINVDSLALELEEIIAGHDQHLSEASQFGMRTASVKNLMPYTEAKKIVDSFDADTDRLSEFVFKLDEARRYAPDEETKREVDKVGAKSEKALAKFRADKKKAEEALKKWAELLTGEKFQALFQEVRTQIIRLDPADPDGIDFEVDEDLNDSRGPYAWGKVIIGPIKDSDGKAVMYQVVVGYRAHTGDYWGNIARGSKSYKGIASKAKGKTGRQFAKALADQLLAIAKAKGDKFFKSRRSVKLNVMLAHEVSRVETGIKQLVERQEASWYTKDWKTLSRQVSVTVYSNDYGFKSTPGMGRLYSQFKVLWSDQIDWLNKLPVGMQQGYYDLRRDFDVSGNVTKATFRVNNVSGFSSRKVEVNMLPFATKRYGSKIADAFRNGLAAQGMVEFATRMPGKRALWARYEQMVRFGMPSRMGYKNEDPKALKDAMLAHTFNTNGFALNCTVSGKITVIKDVSSKTAAQIVEPDAKRVARRVKQAGANGFEVYERGQDANRAFKDAIEEARREYGDRSYSGHIGEKSGYGFKIYRKEPFPSVAEAEKWAWDKYPNLDKWGHAGAVPIAPPKVLAKEKVTVTVKATNQRQAEQRGRLEIRSAGRIRPRVKVIVKDLKVRKAGGSRTYPEWEVTGERQQVQFGKIEGWYFWGYASS
jgi:hypothetical protein|tara:strand:- start:718 stop:2661 length:1944 start_codon:yes stop_codon:yes gene_type:complete